MEKLILIMSIACFITSMFFVISKLTGNILFTFLFKSIGFIGVIVPIIYWLKLLKII